MITRERAFELLEQGARPLEAVDVSLAEAIDLGLAEAIAADRDAPPSDRSAMDGYAVRAADLTGTGVELELVGELRAGQPAGAVSLAAGQAVRIMTGAVVPRGADSVIMVERSRESDDGRRVSFDRRPERGENVRHRGEDRRAGERVLDAGRPVRPGEIAALATVGRSFVRVHRRPAVAVMATGDELVRITDRPAPHQVRNSNGPAVSALLRRVGAATTNLGRVTDDAAALDAALERGLDADVLCVSGGVSVGRYDLVRDSLERRGMELLFHKVAIKPGKPLLVGTLGRCLIFGLPGNPVSSFVTCRLFVVPILRRLMGHADWRDHPLVATLGADLTMKPGRETFHLAHFERKVEGLAARPVASRGSGDVFALGRADALIRTSAETEYVAAGSPVDVLPLDPAG